MNKNQNHPAQAFQCEGTRNHPRTSASKREVEGTHDQAGKTLSNGSADFCELYWNCLFGRTNKFHFLQQLCVACSRGFRLQTRIYQGWDQYQLHNHFAKLNNLQECQLHSPGIIHMRPFTSAGSIFNSSITWIHIKPTHINVDLQHN